MHILHCYHLRIWILILFSILLYSCTSSAKEPPRAIGGVLDLRDWEFSPSTPTDSEIGGTDGIIRLDGEWEFYWGEFPEIGESGNLILPEEKRDFIKVPKSWNRHKIYFTSKTGEKVLKEVGSDGYASYHLKILLKEPKTLSFRLPAQSTAYKLYVNGKIEMEMGRVGMEKEGVVPERVNHYKVINPDKNEIDLIICISNFHRYDAGFLFSISIGQPEEINQQRINKIAIDLFITGILFIMGIYHLSLFKLRRDDLSPLYFGIFCILISLRTIVMGEIFIKTLFPMLPYSLNIFMEYISIYLGLPIFNEFVYSLYPEESSKKIKNTISNIGYFLSLVTFLTPGKLYTSFLLLYQIFIILSVVYVIYVILKAMIQKKQGAKTILLGFSILSFTIVNDILFSNNLINTNDFFSYGFVVFIFSQAFLLTSRFAGAFNKVKDLSLNLEKRVEERTIDLELANVEVQKAKEIIENSLQKANHLNEMFQIIIQSKSVDEIFERINELFFEKYKLTSYLVYILDKKDGFIKIYKTYGEEFVDKSYISLLYKNNFLISDKSCIHGYCITNNRSIYVKNIKLPHKYKPEEENIIEGGITSFYIIPLTNEDESFGTITFSDNKFQKSNIPDLSKSDKKEIENFIKLISPSIYQSIQKNIIEKAFSELQIIQTELESRKSQMERLQKMSQEIQNNSSFSEMLINIEKILWDSYHISDYSIWVYYEESNELKAYNLQQRWVDLSFKDKLKNIPLSENRSVHKMVFEKKKSLFLPKLKNTSNGEAEDFNRELLGMQSLFAIPCIVNNSSFAVLSFTDTLPEYSRDSSNQSVKRLTFKQRDEIEQLVALIANPLYQSLQKEKIDGAFRELQTTKNELERQKSQMERLHEMSLEIQRQTNILEMLNSLEEIIWESYQLGDYLLVIRNSEGDSLSSFYTSKKILNLCINKEIKNVSLNEAKSFHKIVYEKKKSLFLSRFNNISRGITEDYNRKLLGMESLFMIPCVVNNESFAILSFADILPEYSRIPNTRGVKRLNRIQRDEIEQLVSLIANPLYQSLQKQKIEDAYKELQETQNQLIQAERMASLGQLVGGIAHEINNPIAVIRSHTELLEYNKQVTLKDVPQFLHNMEEREMQIFSEIIDKSIQNREVLTTREERKLRKEIQKGLSNYIEDDDLCNTISDKLSILRLPPPFESYIKTLGGEKFGKFLTMAEVFKNQSNSLSSIEIAVEKASRVVFALRSYLNTGLNSEKKEINLPGELEKALHVYDNYVIGKINVRTDFPTELKYTCVSENMLQVWKNLFFNSIQSMYDTDKKLSIKIENQEKLPDYLKTYRTSSIVEESLFQKEDVKNWILVYITDSGVGITPEFQEKIFTPFFTTKSTGEGIGLGLYTCKKIVHEHGGAIFFKSVAGNTEFVVVLREI